MDIFEVHISEIESSGHLHFLPTVQGVDKAPGDSQVEWDILTDRLEQRLFGRLLLAFSTKIVEVATIWGSSEC